MGSVRRAGWRQYLPYLIVNVIVSAVTMLIVLMIWGRGGQAVPEPIPTSTLDAMAFAASAVPSPTLTTVPSATPVTYTVQPGDTLGDIAVQLGISMDSLMQANGLNNPDALSAGQVLVVPITPLPGAQPSATPEPGPQPAGPTEQAGQPPKVTIQGIAGSGDLNQETVRILNTGGVASMLNWTLDDGQGHTYRFPDFVLHQGAVSVHTKAGTDTVIDLYWGQPGPVWTAGKTITLRDNAGKVQSTFQIPNQ